MWQDLNEELEPLGVTVVTIALDKSPEDARPWIEAASPTHPSLIDTNYVVADLYNMVNVPTVVWIDEQGRIARPNDVFFVSDAYAAVTGLSSERPIQALRAWANGTGPAVIGDAVDTRPSGPTEQDQLARTHFALGWWLAQHDRPEEAEPHLVRAGELAPHDFTIRRGSMLIRGKDPAGPEFAAMVSDWRQSGHDYYVPLPDLAPPNES